MIFQSQLVNSEFIEISTILLLLLLLLLHHYYYIMMIGSGGAILTITTDAAIPSAVPPNPELKSILVVDL